MSYQNMSHNIYVASLPQDFTKEKLALLFSPFGAIASCAVRLNWETGACKGYGFVLYENEQDALTAVRALHGHSINGTRIQVRFARPEASAKKCHPSYPLPEALAGAPLMPIIMAAPPATACLVPQPQPQPVYVVYPQAFIFQ